MSLVSLKEKPATKEDIGKTVWYFNTSTGIFDELTLTKFGDTIVAQKDNMHYLVNCYWQKPILISQNEYSELKDNQLAGRCFICKHSDQRKRNLSCVFIFGLSREVKRNGYCDNFVSEFEPKDEPVNDKCNGCSKTKRCSETTKNRRNQHSKCPMYKREDICPKCGSEMKTECSDYEIWFECECGYTKTIEETTGEH